MLALRIASGAPIVDTVIDGQPAALQIDTAVREPIRLRKNWTERHGIPGHRPTASQYGIQDSVKVEAPVPYFRIGEGRLGPIALDGMLTSARGDSGKGWDTAVVAGVIGNQLLSKCAAVVIDVPRRKLWLEPPCDRPLREDNSGWTLDRRDDPGFRDRPWVVEKVIAGGSADRIGVRPGDRLLEIDKKPARSLESIYLATEKPAGSKVAIVVVRPSNHAGDNPATLRLTIDLVRILGRE